MAKREPGRTGPKKVDDNDDIVQDDINDRNTSTRRPYNQGLRGLRGPLIREQMDELYPVPPEDKGLKRGGAVKPTVKAPGLKRDFAKKASLKSISVKGRVKK